MRVGVDATAFGNRHGDGRFARNAVRRLVELDGETRYVLHVGERSAAEMELPTGAEQRRLPLSRGPTADSMRPRADLLRLAAAASRRDYDAFLFPSLVSYVPALGAPSVVGVHDANVARFGALMLPTRRGRAAWRIKQWVALRRAARLFTVSEASRADLAERIGPRGDRLAVVPEAPDPVFWPRKDPGARRVLAPLGPLVQGDFLLYVGGINPHKSVETLIDAYAALRSSDRPCPALVLVGPLEEDVAQSAAPAVRARIARHGLGDRVLLPGFVDDETLACLYSTATALVVTSRWEGFGLPAVEGAACAAPLILSDIPPHRETLGDAARYFRPRDSRALAHALGQVLGDASLRRRMSEQGHRQVSALGWDRTAIALRRLIAEAAATGRRPGRAPRAVRRPPRRAPERP